MIREAIENPDQSHVDEMLVFAEQANREYEVELYGQQAAPTPDDRETGETVRTPRVTFHVTDMSREQIEAAGYGFHHESEDGKYLIMANGSSAFAIPNGDAPRTYRAGKDDRPSGGAHEGTLCEGDRPRPPCAASGGGRRYCRLLSL